MTHHGFLRIAAILMASIAITRGATSPTLRYSLQEERARGTFVGDITVDSGLVKAVPSSAIDQLRFSFSPTRSPHKHLFNIDPKTGIVTTAEIVDRDALCVNLDECVARLVVQVLPAQYFTIVQVDIDIVDINDNFPQFPSDVVELSLIEGSVLGMSLSLPLADDPDSPTFAVKQYTLISNDDQFELVIVMEDDSPSEVHLVLRETLDREHNDAYVLRLLAIDGGTPPRSGSVTLKVNVIDVNDNSPVFENTTYKVSIPENIAPSTVIVTVKASDLDYGRNGFVVYGFSRKTRQRYGRVFSISESGDISVAGHIDYEIMTHYVLTVSARNPEESTYPVQAKVFVNVTDENDNSPTININTLTGDDTAQIPESSPVGTFIAHITVIDEDSAENGRFNCSINTPSFEIHKIYETEFKVLTAELVDREKQDMFVLDIECRDNGHVQRSSVERLNVTIRDVNDNAPVFSQDTYSAGLLENDKPELLVVTVSATDIDAGRNSQFRYYIQPDVTAYFAIDYSSGRITTRRPFDREHTDKFVFNVFAIDSGTPPRTGTADVTVHINDVNDEYPRFSRSTYEFEISENGPDASDVGQVMAADADTDQYGQFQYAIDQATNRHGMFAIDSASGMISTNHATDRETQHVYRLRVLAIPVGDSVRTGTADVTIYIRDANDNSPIMLFPTTANGTVFVSPFTTIDYIIARLLAYDADNGRNGALSYGLDGGNDDGYFTVDNGTGFVRVAKELRDIDLRTFVLSCIAEDGGQPRRRCMTHLSVVVNSSVAFSLPSVNNESGKWVATIVSLVVTTVSILLIVFCAAVILFFRRRRSETKSGRTPTAIMLDPRHQPNKSFAVHIRQTDRCNNDYSQLYEKQNSSNEHNSGDWTQTREKSSTHGSDMVGRGYQRNYDQLRQGEMRAVDSREKLQYRDQLYDGKKSCAGMDNYRDAHADKKSVVSNCCMLASFMEFCIHSIIILNNYMLMFAVRAMPF